MLEIIELTMQEGELSMLQCRVAAPPEPHPEHADQHA